MSKKTEEKKKDNYFKFSFLFPIIVALATAVLMMLAVAIVEMEGKVTNIRAAQAVVRIAFISITFSPTVLMICAFISFRHMKRNPDGSSFYRMRPMIFSVAVFGLQVIYMLTLAI